MEKYCLIIDNDDQTSSIETINREAKKKRLKVKCFQFNVGSQSNDELLTDNRIDLKKVELEFRERFKGQTFDLIAFDWSLDDDDINGVDLIRYFESKKIRRKTPKFLYSGQLKDEMESVLERYKSENITFIKAWTQIRTLIEIDIVDFKDREEYEKAIVNILDKTSPNLDTLLLKELRSNPDVKFNGTVEGLLGKTFEEIAEIIENDITMGDSFKITLLEQAVAYLAELKDYSL